MEILVPLHNSRYLLRKIIAAGADAAYFGVKPDARSASRYSLLWTQMEFDFKSAIEVVKILNDCGRRSYITLNVPYSTKQLEAVFDLACALIESGANALIISDPGLMGMIKEEKPDAEMHVSITGRSANSQTAVFYKELGAKRIILERILSVEEIKFIRETAGIDVEVFIYGNFCFFYHGGCRISSYFYGEQCIGPCMDEYLIDGLPEAGKRPFRSKPLNGYGLLPALFYAGVSAIKIEGRQKSDRYILDTLSVLRRAVDTLEQGGAICEELKHSGLFIYPPESTAGFFSAPPSVDETMDRSDGISCRVRYFRTYFTFWGLPVAHQMRRLKKEAYRIERSNTDK